MMIIYVRIHIIDTCIVNHSYLSDPDEIFARVLLQRKTKAVTNEVEIPMPVKGKVLFEQLQVCIIIIGIA